MSERVPAGGPYRAAAGLHEPLSLEHIHEAKRLLSSYCPGRFCGELLGRLEATGLLVAEARIQGLAWSEKYAGVDEDILEAYRELVAHYARYISGAYATHGEYILVEIEATVEVDGVLLRRGEVARLPPGKALRLALAGLARPLPETSIKLAAAGGAGGGGGGGEGR